MSRMADFCDMACDECGNWVPGTYESTADQRKYLHHHGWTTVRREGKLMDLCPHCAKEAGITVKKPPKPPKLDL